jgi:hypothetical protein
MHAQGLSWGLAVWRFIVSLLTCVVLLGCASAEKQQMTKMETALSPWVGRSIADYVAERGPPTTSIDLGGNKRAFQWQMTRQTPGAVVPLAGSLIAVPSREESCMVSLVASSSKSAPSLSDWIIERWSWNGAC